jgi:hypothetical protein
MVNKTYKHNGLCSKLNKAKDKNEAQAYKKIITGVAIITENVAIMNICMQAG